MDNQDFDLLCAALAFTAVAIKSENALPDTERAIGLACLIKQFCRATVPEAFADNEEFITRGVGADVNPDGKFGTAGRMADAIVKLMRLNDACVPEDLTGAGFTPEEIERHWAMAMALARVELNMMDS